jgi:Arc/MetJ-type ribon-helix-helix transcriptional regulator
MTKYTGKPVSLRLTKEENDIIEEQMKKRGFTNRAEFFRALINQCKEDPITLTGLRKTLNTTKREILEAINGAPKKKRRIASK